MDERQRGAANNQMRRLTRTQIANTLADLLGKAVVADAQIQTALNTVSPDVISIRPTDILPNPSDQLPSALLSIGTRAAELAAAAGVFGACGKAAVVTDQCAAAFIQDFAPRVYRRPIASTEASALMATHTRLGGGLKGLEGIMARLLQAPEMVFLVEGGAAGADGRIRLDGYQVASRISYLLADTLPDAPLFAAAATGELGQLANVRAQVERLLTTSANARAKLNDFFSYYTQTARLPDPYAPPAKFAGVDGQKIKAEMAQELTDFISHQVFTRRGTFKDLLTSPAVFPRSAAMARILESTVAAGSGPSAAGAAHAGLLLRPALLASDANRTPAMHRGHVVRSSFLCEELPPPPPDAAAAIAAASTSTPVGNRQRLESLTSSNPICVGCHRLVNPLGFALEGYDQLGMVRTVETSYDAKGGPAQTFAIDTVVRDPSIDDGGPDRLAGAAELVAAIAGGRKARSCFALSAFEFYRWRDATTLDTCALGDLQTAAGDTGTLAQFFITNIANEDIFWKGK
jgi:hypothetical protein